MKKFESESEIEINYYRPKPDPLGGCIGCFKSHIAVITSAYDAGCNQVLVFEDDIKKTDSYNSLDYDEIQKFMQTDASWEMIQLSWFDIVHSLLVPHVTPWKHLSQAGTVLASSYIIHRRGMEKILRTYKDYLGKVHIDAYYQQIMQKTMWNISPIPFDQDRTSPNDNVWVSHMFDSVVIWLDSKVNGVYFLSYYKYVNACIFAYLLLAILCYNFAKANKIRI